MKVMKIEAREGATQTEIIIFLTKVIYGWKLCS